MLNFDNGGRLVQSVEELPDLRGAKELFADFETTSGNAKLKSLNPWHDCDVLGIAVTTDETAGAWYVPVGHHVAGWNLPKDKVFEWWLALLDSSADWVNHNIKYDCHVSTNWAGVIPGDSTRLIDTLTLSRIINSDRLFYGLAKLAKDWLKEDISNYEEAFQPYLNKNKDYGAIPADIMGAYACQDVLTNRRLWRFIVSRCPDQCKAVWETEIKLTKVLFEMERNGLRITPDIKLREYKLLLELSKLEQELAEKVGYSFRPHTNADCYNVLCNTYGLPVLAYTDEDNEDGEGNPSFDKHALAQYAAHPLAPKDIVSGILEFRNKHTLWGNFVKPLQKLQVEGVVHPTYKQSVRTARMACSEPNAQQQSSASKELFIPKPGNSFISIDYSQIEFRLIVHYINDANAIAAFAANPDADFHTWVAEMTKIKRKPAKTVNFLTAFGGGKKKLLANLSANMELVGDLIHEAEELALKWSGKKPGDSGFDLEISKRFEKLAFERAEQVHSTYHATLPTLKPTSYRAASAAKSKGFVFNLYGRRRHLPAQACYRAFNTLNQSSAADLMKERTVEVSERCKGTPISIVASVHDETLFEAPTEIANDWRVQRDLVGILEHPTILSTLRVPIRCSIGVSSLNWKEAGAEPKTLSYKLEDLENLIFLK